MTVAFNTQHTGNRSRDHRGYAEPFTSEQVDGLLSEDWLRRMVGDIRNGQEELKDRLPYVCPHYGRFKDNHRAQANIIPEAFTFMTCVDVDDKELVEPAIERTKELIADEDSDWQELILRMDYSARKKLHIWLRLPVGKTIAETQQEFCDEIGVPYDESCVTPERFIFLTGIDEEIYRSPLWMKDLSEEEIEERREAYLNRGLDVDGRKLRKGGNTQGTVPQCSTSSAQQGQSPCVAEVALGASLAAFDLCAEQAGLNPAEMDLWGVHNWHANLMAVLSIGVAKLMSREQLRAVVAQRLPNYSQTEDCAKLIDYFYEKYDADKGFMNTALREINAKAQKSGAEESAGFVDLDEESEQPRLPRMPLGVRDSIEAAGKALAMPVITAICPCIGALATGVVLDVHGQKKGLNLIAYIAGDPASGKGSIDPLMDAWMCEVKAVDKMYQDQEDEWRAKMRASKNKKEQPEEPKLPVRFITLNNTVANLAERLANVVGKHAFSFTPEADTVAQKWKSSVSDFSVMLRQSYDGSRYDREARSPEAVNVHIEHLLWNVTMCGTPDALYRVVTNYTDGFQSRIALARTPDNTFWQLEDKPNVLTPKQEERIRQVAHLLPLMQGEIVLPKLETKGREWLEKIRLETMMNDDRVKARQRIRICVTTQRMVCCLMLCKVCEQLIQKHGLNGAEVQLKQNPNLWKEMLLKAQTPQMLGTYDVIADSLMENVLYFFRHRIENAFNSRDYAGKVNQRKRIGKNDTIFQRLDHQFTFEQAMQQSVAIKGADVTINSVQQMLKNWGKQGLIEQLEDGKFRKMESVISH
jgi:hypothetical protein